MDLHTYYREQRCSIHSAIMEIAADLAIARLMKEHLALFDAFVEPEDSEDPDGGTRYKEEFQDEFNRCYDEEYDRIARLMHFDVGAEDGVAET